MFYMRKGTFLTTLILIQLFCISVMAQAQKKVVRGIIKEGAKPISEILVREKGAGSNNTLSNDSGRFVLTLKGNSNTLVVSGVGYKAREIAVGQDMEIQLVSDIKGLDEVVVLGYGQKAKKITNTGAISTISGDMIRQSPAASLQNALAGRLPGLFSEQRGGQPGSDAASLQIRGVSSLNGNSTPLIIVDDIEYSYAQLQQIDPNEVESLSILKDASTTAVYGVRGANGVLIVTTRRGRAGKPELNIRNEYGIQTPTRMPQVNDAYTTLNLFRESLLEQGKNPAVAYPKYFAGNNLETFYKTPNVDPFGHPFVNWWDVLMKGASPQDRVNFDISGGSKKIRYAVTLGYLTQGGIYKDFTKGQGYNGNFFMDRYNFRSNIDIDPTSTLKLRVDVSGRLQISNSPAEKGVVNGSTTFQRLWDGSINQFDYPVYNQNGTLGGMAGMGQQLYGSNPVAVETYSGYNRNYNDNFNVVGQATQNLDFITKGLSARATFSYQSDNLYTKSLTRTQIPLFYYDSSSISYIPSFTNLYRLPPLTRSSSSGGTAQLVSVQANVNYARSFGKNNISALALISQNSNLYNYAQTGFTTYIPTHIRTMVGSISYDYDKKYLFDLKAAYNGSDRFGNGKQYGLFPAASIGWNLAAEDFFKNNIDFISLFKIRASYGLTGSDYISSGFQYLYVQNYSSGRGYNFGGTSTNVSGLLEGSLGNPNVTWEKDRKTDIGVDIQAFKSHVSITADYFHEYRYDQLINRGSIPGTFGVGLPAVNLGKVSNAGYEFEVKYNTNITRDLKVWASGNMTYAQNKVIFMDEPTQKYPWLAKQGHPIAAQFGYTWTGQYFQSVGDIYKSPLEPSAIPMANVFPGGLKLKDLNGDGVLDISDQGYMGTNQPTYNAGLSLGLSYKNFDISVLFQGAFGYILSMQRGMIAYSRGGNMSVPFNLGRWTPDNANNATYPSLAGSITDAENSTFWWRKGDYVRFKNYELGYTFSKKMLARMHVKSARVYTTGYNIGLIYCAFPVHIDPESIGYTGIAGVGEYPQQRIFNFGMQIGL
jgi:TonB-linked SusC/RagA family outer membrane protein